MKMYVRLVYWQGGKDADQYNVSFLDPVRVLFDDLKILNRMIGWGWGGPYPSLYSSTCT